MSTASASESHWFYPRAPGPPRLWRLWSVRCQWLARSPQLRAVCWLVDLMQGNMYQQNPWRFLGQKPWFFCKKNKPWIISTLTLGSFLGRGSGVFQFPLWTSPGVIYSNHHLNVQNWCFHPQDWGQIRSPGFWKRKPSGLSTHAWPNRNQPNLQPKARRASWAHWKQWPHEKRRPREIGCRLKLS